MLDFESDTGWMLGPFRKLDEVNPVLEPRPQAVWNCPFAGEVHWEAKDAFNPAAVIMDGHVHLLYRAEDNIGRHMGTSRIGLARSADGTIFERSEAPILYPARDGFEKLEWEGGCEDPRVVGMPGGGFVMTYTAFDGFTARLCVATSSDLQSWKKHGLAFPQMPGLWSKAGAIICEVIGDQLVAKKIGGKYWMYWGESSVFAATSDDLISWFPLRNGSDQPPRSTGLMPEARAVASSCRPDQIGVTFADSEALVACLRPRSGRFDSRLVEPGPPAILTKAGIVLLYHGKSSGTTGDPNLPEGTYCVGQALFDPLAPTQVLARCTEPFLKPEAAYEISGQVDNVCFAEGLVPFQGQWWLYYGTADSRVAVATAPIHAED